MSDEAKKALDLITRAFAAASGHDYYILDAEHQPVPVNLMTWGAWMEEPDNRRVAETFTEFFRVSTVFLGLDHRWDQDELPILFETMTFDEKPHLTALFGDALRAVFADHDQERYATWEEAEAGHRRWVATCLKREADAAATIAKAKQEAGS